jgi:acyl-homoserine-lactone acylase
LVPPRLTTTIRRTTDGVPHISGPDLASVAYGQGWVSGEDHGCTLIDQIDKVYGRRSEVLGPGSDGENVESDFAWRAIDIVGVATADYDNASPEIVEQFGAFAEGWNDQLTDAGPDGLIGWCNDADWVRPIQPVEVYVYARSLALLASSARFADFIPSAQPPQPDEAFGFAPQQSPTGYFAPDFTALEPLNAGQQRLGCW